MQNLGDNVNLVKQIATPSWSHSLILNDKNELQDAGLVQTLIEKAKGLISYNPHTDKEIIQKKVIVLIKETESTIKTDEGFKSTVTSLAKRSGLISDKTDDVESLNMIDAIIEDDGDKIMGDVYANLYTKATNLEKQKNYAKKAISYLTKSAEKGNPKSMWALGEFYQTRLTTTELNDHLKTKDKAQHPAFIKKFQSNMDRKSKYWFTRAAESAYDILKHEGKKAKDYEMYLEWMHVVGQNSSTREEKSRWLGYAADLGHSLAKKELEELSQEENRSETEETDDDVDWTASYKEEGDLHSETNDDEDTDWERGFEEPQEK